MTRYMNEVTDPVEEAFAFFDDAVAASATKTENLATLRELFESMEKREMYLNLAKCQFFQSELTFLGYRVSERGVKHITDRVAALASFPLPWDLRTLQRFLGIAAYNKMFTPNLAEATPLLYQMIPSSAKRNTKLK